MFIGGFAPASVRIDLDSFDGPPHYVQRFRRCRGWLLVADVEARFDDGRHHERITVACTEHGNAHPAFQAQHLLTCDWSPPAVCDSYVPPELDTLLEEEQGALAVRWVRARALELRRLIEDGDARLQSLQTKADAYLTRLERTAQDLRRRRLMPNLTTHAREIFGLALADLDETRDRALAGVRAARRILATEIENAEETALTGLRVKLEVSPLIVAYWRTGDAIGTDWQSLRIGGVGY